MESPSVEKRIADFVASLRYEDIPDDVIETVTRAFIDTVGVTIAGSLEGAGRRVSERAGIDPDTASAAVLLGIDSDRSPESVALRVGTASHSLDYDDLSWAVDGHPSCTLIPPLFALAGENTVTGRDLLTAYTAGFEAEAAVAEPISPAHYEAGWHPTATLGTIGATAAAASLLELDAMSTAHALNASTSMASGLKRNFGSMTKPLHAGLASRSGVTAVRLAQGGLTADEAAISGTDGFWDLFGPHDRGTFSVGDRWRLQDDGIHVKVYPSCYFTHSAIAATQRLTADGFEPGEIEAVTVEASRGAADALRHADPDTGLEAKFSMEYAVGSAAVHSRVGLEAFRDDAISDPPVQRVRKRVQFIVDSTLPYDSHEATVQIETGDESLEWHQQNPPGVHGDPLSDAELRAKFEECTQQVFRPERIDRLFEIVSTMQTVDDISRAISRDRF